MDELKKFLKNYSFADLARSFFALNLWLPNVSSTIKTQFLYVLLESISNELPTENKINSYEDFKDFSDKLLPLLPSYPMMEDYIPEMDWGDIKYFFRERFYKIFYGADLSNPYDYYYSFEITHRGFSEFYTEKFGRSAMSELQFCLNLEDDIIKGIRRDTQEEREIQSGHFETPKEPFWTAVMTFLDGFNPYELYQPSLVAEYTRDLDSEEPQEVPEEGEFLNRAHNGQNCPYFFLQKNGQIFPTLPRKYFAVVFDKWGKILAENYPEIKKDVDPREAAIGLQLFKFIRERAREDSVFPYVSAVQPDEKLNPIVFSTAFRSKNKLVLIYLTAPRSAEKSQQEMLDELPKDMQAAYDLLSSSPTRFVLRGQGQMIQYKSEKWGEFLEPMIITVLPHTTTDTRTLGQPKDLVGTIMGLDQLVGIIDELENLDEFSDFLDYEEKLEESATLGPFTTTLDRFGSFKDSSGVLLAGASEPDTIILDPHWGSNFRYQSLAEFWKYFPEDNFFGHPRSWTIEKETVDGREFVMSSKHFHGYVYYRAVGETSLFINCPIDSLTFDQAKLTDSMMGSLSDAFKLYEQDVKDLPFATSGKKIHSLFFPASLVKADKKFNHLRHLLPHDQLWKIDITRLKSRDYGVRIVFDDEKLLEALKDAKDRSLQVQLLIDVLGQFNSVFGDTGFAAVKAKLIAEKTKKNRFRMFAIESKVSFPELARYEEPKEKELKLAEKKIAEIARAKSISPGDYSGKDAQDKINTLRDGLIEHLNSEVRRFNLGEAVPKLIENIDALTNDHERKKAQVKDSMDQEVDYQREASAGENKQHFLHHHKNNRYLIEKFIQLQPTGAESLEEPELRQLLAYVDVLLDLYQISDFLHYGIYPASIKIEHDFQVAVNYGADISGMQTKYAEQQEKINLGMVGNSKEAVDPPIDIVPHLEELDAAFKKDLGFGLKNMVNLQQILAEWTQRDEGRALATSYSADLETIKASCVHGITDFDPTETEAILEFLTLDPKKILTIEGDPNPAADLPVWEYAKRVTRYNLKPIIKMGTTYYWGPYSLERSGTIWGNIAGTHRLPADISAPTVAAILKKAHGIVEAALETKIAEIVKRHTPHVETEVFPSKIGLSPTDIGDIDVFALLKEKNVILNIESKIINPAYCNKDIQRISRRIFDEGYLKKVEERAVFLEAKGKETAEKYWGPLPDKPKVISIFVTQLSYWWTTFPPVKTDVVFVELKLLEDFIKGLLN